MYKTYIVITPAGDGERKTLEDIENLKFDSINAVQEQINKQDGLSLDEIELWPLDDWMDRVNNFDDDAKYKFDSIWLGYVRIKTEITEVMKAEARETLSASGVIDVFWSEVDIKHKAKEMGIKLSHEQISNIRNSLQHNHDANFGINWEIISDYINEEIKS
jgi:hypothetical protein